ncbi:hypothetical protein Vretimale_600 [Volvox reticuliferus]|uniref:Structural maintenance of chromosomes protein 5 n=2 Tax=Volvox reticuliferus TaxID=1737510 RepID=A0A8J4D7G9_9CHLO|nr:hypothetical protein Vretimale_600 [Volvox reticuliferus]
MSFVGTIVLEAGPRVNLVEGPNGSGKSSLVAALCVGLGGNMKALGRQTHPEELIRRGCAGFETEITLSGGARQPDVVVHRRTERGAQGVKQRRGGGNGGSRARVQIRGGDGASEDDDSYGEEDNDIMAWSWGKGRGRSIQTLWQLDGRAVTEKQVKEVSQGMGIHFDNLCQFLPQERVAEFSNLGPTELLESTEEAIGDGHLLQQHKDLKQQSALLKAKREELQRTQDRLGRVETDQAAHAPEYNRLRRRNALRREVQQLQWKKLWVEKERRATQLAQSREQVSSMQGRVGEARHRLAQAKAPLNNRTCEVENLQRVVNARSQEEHDLNGRMERGQKTLRRLEEQLKAKQEEFEALKAKSARWAVDVTRARQELDRVKSERAAQPQGLNLQQTARLAALAVEIPQGAGEIATVQVQLSQKRKDIEEMAAGIRSTEAALQQQWDLREQRLLKLERKLPLSRRLHEWITEMRSAGRFRRRVLGPVLMEIRAMPDRTSAAQLEFMLNDANLGAVITENQEDNNLVHNWLEQNKAQAKGRRNRLLFLPEDPGPVQYTDGHPSQYAAFGITGTVDQIFEATSDLVKQAMCVSSSINTAYVGTAYAEQAQVVEALFSRTSVRRLLTPRLSTVVNTSEYDRSYKSQKIQDLPPAELLDDGEGAVQGDEEAKRQELEAMRQEKASLEAEAQQLEESLRQRHADVRVLENEKQQLHNVRKRLEKSAMDLLRLESELERRLTRLEHEGDPLATAGTLRTDMCNIAEDLMRQASNTSQLIMELHNLHRGLGAVELSLAAASASLAPLHQAVRRAAEVVQAAEREVAAAEQRFERVQERLRETEAHLREELGPTGRPDAATLEAWAQFPGQVEELEELLAARQAEMDQAQAGLRGDEAAVMEAWQRRETEITDLRQRSAAGSSEVRAAEADIEARKATWLPELKRHMEAINQTVKRHFASIGCAGEVVLRESGDEFDKYAAEIRVQYRPQEPLRPLNRNHHSGGERSVATMLYLMALQGVTTTPFRVVDEINQGMDSCNERKVFNLLVESSSRPDTPQCFLLTPKLIAGLHYNSHVRVLPLRYMPAARMSVLPAVAALLISKAEEHEREATGGMGVVADGSSSDQAAASSGSQASQQQQQQQHLVVGAIAGLPQLPWHRMKSILFYGRDSMAGQG